MSQINTGLVGVFALEVSSLTLKIFSDLKNIIYINFDSSGEIKKSVRKTMKSPMMLPPIANTYQHFSVFASRYFKDKSNHGEILHLCFFVLELSD